MTIVTAVRTPEITNVPQLVRKSPLFFLQTACISQIVCYNYIVRQNETTNERRTIVEIKKNGCKGYPTPSGRKGYAITTTCGTKFMADPVGSSRFICGGSTFKTLTAVKKSIEEATDIEIEETAEFCVEMNESGDIFDTCCPIARLLVKISRNTEFDADDMEALDNYGYVTEEGKVDFDYAVKAVLNWNTQKGA